MVSRRWDRLWVFGTSSLIAFISYSSQIWVVWPWYGRELSVDLLQLLIPFNAAVLMIWWNYRLCVITPPGAVPDGYKPNMDSSEGMEVKKGNHAPRYCKTCEHYKPPRAHHCRQCKTCILKLDHHCPWLGNNCVGFYNQGHFIRFLLWVDIATSYHLLMLVFRSMSIATSYREEPSLQDMLFLIFNFAACGPVWLCVGMFSCYHLYLAAGNSTTIEGWEKDKVATLVRRGKIHDVKYPYNIGFLHNLKSVLGPNPLLWLWPQKMQGDGLSFPVNPDAGVSAVRWPMAWASSKRGIGGGKEGASSSPIPSDAVTNHGVLADQAGNEVQYAWPPQDPTRLSNPGPSHFANSSAFVYGNEGLNPALRPTNARLRSREARERRNSLEGGGEVYSSGSERDNEGEHSHTSSPEPYLSDYDEDDWGPLERGQRMPRHNRVREGSEGYEVRPMGDWSIVDDLDAEAGRPWEADGRYNVYHPDDEWDVDGSGSGSDPGPSIGLASVTLPRTDMT